MCNLFLRILFLGLICSVTFNVSELEANIDLIVDNPEELKELHNRGVYKPAVSSINLISKKNTEPFLGVNEENRDKSSFGKRKFKRVDPIFSNVQDMGLVIKPSEKPKVQTSNNSVVKASAVNEILKNIKDPRKSSLNPSDLNGLIIVGSEQFVANQNVVNLYNQEKNVSNSVIQTIGFDPKISKVIGQSFSALRPSIGQKITLEKIDVVTDIIREEVRSSNIPFTNVYAPPQDVENGIVFVVVKPAIVEDVRIAESQYFDELRMLGKIGQDIGDPLDAKALETDLAILSLHPNRQVKASFSPGRIKNSTQVDIDIEEQKPWRVFASQSNTGSEELDETVRSFGGYHNNLWGLDHKGTYQYVTSMDGESMKAHSVEYAIPYYDTHGVVLRYNQSETEASVLNNTFKTEGEFSQISLKHETNIIGQKEFADGWSISDQKLSFGIDRKRIEGDVLFTLFGNPLDTGVGADLSVFNTVIEYEGELADKYGGQTDLKGKLVYSPGDVGSRNSDSDFSTARSDTDANYTYVTLKADRIVPLDYRVLDKNVSLKTGVQAQITADRLVGSERFINSPSAGFRGYKSGDLSGDMGAAGYLEIETSPYNLISHKHYNDSIKASVFADFGTFINNDILDTEERRSNILSLGGAIQYQINDNVNSQLVVTKDISDQDSEAEQNVMYRLLLGY